MPLRYLVNWLGLPSVRKLLRNRPMEAIQPIKRARSRHAATIWTEKEKKKTAKMPKRVMGIEKIDYTLLTRMKARYC
jgi:hypothetical protein